MQSSKPDLDVLSDIHSEEDGLFTTSKLTPTAKQPKASVPSPTIPKTKQAATDDLFTIPVDNENVGGKPSEGSPDVITEAPKPQKKKPAGAVPMFGGVDLFGGGSKDTVPVPTTTAAPSVEEQQETITNTAPTETKKPFGGNYMHITYIAYIYCNYKHKVAKLLRHSLMP